MTGRRVLAWILAAAALAALAFFAGRASAPRDGAARRAAREEAVSSGAAPVAGTASGASRRMPVATTAGAPLPPTDAPLSASFEALSRRADAGDRPAACRLAQDLLLCRRFQKMHPDAMRAREDAVARLAEDSPGEAAAIETLAREERDFRRGEQVCDEASHVHLGKAWRYLLRAAELGDDDAAVQFAAAPPLDPAYLMSELDAWRHYRDRRDLLLERAARNGNVRALYQQYMLARGYHRVPGTRPGAHEDVRRAAVYAMALRGALLPDDIARIDAAVDEARRATTSAEFAALEREAAVLRDRIATTAPFTLSDGNRFVFAGVECAAALER